MNHNPKISIVTVVYNGEKNIAQTVDSVINQTWENIEYIVVDGQSKDGTLQILKSYGNKISKLVSEPDNGLYYAMNKALVLATGDFVLFLNSGDRFVSVDIIEKIFSNSDACCADVVYGDTDIVDTDGNILHGRRHRPPENLTWMSFKKGMLVCHQSFFAKRNITPLYNTAYKYAADFAWCIDVLKMSKKTYNSNCVVSFFLEGGQTRRTIVPGLKERFQIMKNNYGFFSAMWCNVVLAVKFVFFVIRHRWF